MAGSGELSGVRGPERGRGGGRERESASGTSDLSPTGKASVLARAPLLQPPGAARCRRPPGSEWALVPAGRGRGRPGGEPRPGSPSPRASDLSLCFYWTDGMTLSAFATDGAGAAAAFGSLFLQKEKAPAECPHYSARPNFLHLFC